ncbi:hypothetical protein KVV02_001665 [Mortierella alpina]|uniref:PH domain-containing protein n=1 Tax=Mortierella alpina TaxID=64518 RepID=A0A9P8CXR6_MORAP|nr:hypothetical protein KVV02_001665 [Mortierella alpina]
MATSSILSTHSGHHRIFIGPVVQKQTPQPSGSSVSAAARQGRTPLSHHSHSHQQPNGANSSSAPKPWWEQGSSFLRSRLSLHSQTHTHQQQQPGSASGRRNSPSQSVDPHRQTNIPQFSYTFSDDSSSSDNDSGGFDAEADETDAYDSESERQDYEHDHDDVDDENDNAPSNRKRSALERTCHTSTSPSTSSSESLSAAVGQSQDHQRPEDRPGTRKDKGKAKADDPAPVSRVRTSREKKRTKSMRDEGEPNRLKKLLGSYREKRHNQGRMENPDLGWESDGSRASRPQRQVTSGALTVGHAHTHHQDHHPVLVSSPMSSEVDLPGATSKPVFVSSPMSSAVDVNEGLERPEPRPIQNLDAGGVGKGDRLHPGDWKSHSSTSVSSSTSSPMNSGLQRGATWVTAREYASSIGHGSLYQQAIQEEEEDEQDEDEDDQEDHRDTPLYKMDSNDSTHGASGSKSSGKGKDVERLKVTDPTQKEPLSATISKAGTRFGRALLNRAPTGLKRENEEDTKTEMPTTQTKRQPEESMCSLDKDCQKSIQSLADVDDSKKKHVRFLTKVQYQMSSSRQSTMLSTHPVLKQDRMLVRKEMTERPGPHVFNSNTARRLERQSQGWAEWWCVLKGPPTGQKPPVTKIYKKSKSKNKRVEKGRLEFYYNHKKIKGSVVLSSCTSVSVYSSLDYSIAVTQNYPEDMGLTIYILRPRTISLACAWYMEIYTLLNGNAPIPPFIEIAVPDFDVKIRVPIPADSETESEDDTDEDDGAGTRLSSVLPPQDQESQTGAGQLTLTTSDETPFQSFKTALSSLPERMASKSFYLTNEDARPTLVAPDEVTPKLLRSHVLSLLKDVPDWMEVVKMWQDPGQFGDVALCWKRYDRIEWIYWTDRVQPETDDAHLKRDHIGFADGSDWSGRMDETVVGPQVLDKTHVLELRPITHYPTKVVEAGGHDLHEPDPIEGYLVRVSTFAGNPIRRFRRLYLTSHDHMLIYTIPSQAHSPTMPHAGAIDPTALMFCISPHRSANPDHKDMAQSRSIRRLKAQVRAARGFIDMTKIEGVRVLTAQEWDTVRHMSYKQEKDQEKAKLSKRERLGKAVQRGVEIAEETRIQRAQRANASGAEDAQPQPQPQVILREPDNYFFPTVLTEPSSEPSQSLGSKAGSSQQKGGTGGDYGIHVDSSEPLNSAQVQDIMQGEDEGEAPPRGTIGEGLIKSATMVADMLLHNDEGEADEDVEDSNVIEIEMKGGPCVRFRAFNAEAAHLWRDQLEKLAHYWALRKHQDVRGQMRVTQSNCQLASSLDDDEIQVGETIQDWDNDRAMVSPEIWNWCVVNGCRSVTKSGVLYYKPRLHSTFRKMFLVLTEGYLLLFHPHRRSKTSGQVIPTTACKIFGIHSLTDIYVYSGHFADEDTAHGTNDESERLPRFYPDGLIVDDPDEECTFSIWRGQRKKMFSRRGAAARTMMSSRAMEGSSRIFGKNGCLSSLVKDGVVYGAKPQSCAVLRARSRADLEQWVHAINTEIERCVRAERRGIRTKKSA